MLRPPLPHVEPELPEENYTLPVSCAVGAVFVALVFCLLCHRKLKKRAREVHIDDLQQPVDERRHCYRHNHGLLDHHHHHHHHHHHFQYDQQNSHRNSFSQCQRSSPMSDESEEAEPISSPDSV